MFIGREAELKFLNDRYNSGKSEFIVLYGRRRVGKTETLKEFAKDKQHIFYSCRECTDTEQLRSFSAQIFKTDIPAKRYLSTFSDWQQAFESITELPFQGKKLVIIDEFPYAANNNKSIPSILQNLWDNLLCDKNVMLIICGSAMSFIEKELLGQKNPLYGRATGILKLRKMDFYDAAKFFPDYCVLDQITAYAVLGGIPHYLKQFDPDRTIEDNIKENILTKGSILYSETEFLMHQEFRETNIYNTVIEAVALGNTKMSDISAKTQIERTKLSAYLKNLIDLSIIERDFPVDAKIKEKANTQRGLYRLTDNYFRFWYAFVFANLSELESNDVDGVYEYIVKPELDIFVSLCFEDVCKAYLRKRNKENTLPLRFSKIGRWWNKTDEIDIMAADVRNNKLLLGECKYKNTPVDTGTILSLIQKPVPKCDKTYYMLFSKSGFTQNAVNYAKENDIELISADDII
ncbi:MAG: ATP-binding protein [Candidatus Ornithomonoglobus sp.]